ncbi:MAG: SpoIID/LytB domain-containing protein [Candidatus Nanopelagicales bacterium]
MSRRKHARPALRGSLAVPGLVSLALVFALVTVPGSADAAAAVLPVVALPGPSVPAAVTFSGAGVGHGVGMSQYGALGMARAGYTTDAILTHYYTGTTVAPVNDDVALRVNIMDEVKSVAVRTEALATGGGTLEIAVTGTPVVRVAPMTRLLLTRSAKGVTVATVPSSGPVTTLGTGSGLALRWSGTRVPGGTGTLASVLNVSGSLAGLAGSGHRYRYGWVEVTPSALSSTGLEVVNVVRLHDEYLLGIGEVPSSWPAAALQAQVVAARSYALAKYGTGAMRGSCRCQVDSGNGPFWDQSFVGYSKESSTGGSLWRAAVLATDASTTTGLTVLYAGRPITAYYGAATGGRTQASKDVWGGVLPWAQSVDDHWSLDPAISPWAAWKPRVRTQAQLAAAFGLPDVVSLDLSQRFASGALSKVTATSSGGRTAVLSGGGFASRLSLPSTWVWRAAATISSDPVTAVAAAAAARPAWGTIVLAPSAPAAIIDAAVAAAFASATSLPYLLTPSTGLAPATRAELVRRKAALVYVVGTIAEMPTPVITALTAMKIRVVRLTGVNPTAVSVAVAGRIGAAVGTPAIVVSGGEPATVVSAAAAAGILRRPLLVLPAGAVSVPADVASFLSVRKVASTLLVARTASVPDQVGLRLPGARRVAGVDDADTSARVVLVADPVASRASLVLTTPTSGLGCALAAAGTGRPVLVVGTTLSSTALSLLRTARTSTIVSSVLVPSAVLWAARRA